MKVGRMRPKLTGLTYAIPGREQTLDELIALLESRGVVILSVDRVKNRLLVGREDLELA